jgi:type I restriction enzyme S subunit
MSAVDENGGGIARPELRPYGEVVKGYTYFGEGDVIFAKITP